MLDERKTIALEKVVAVGLMFLMEIEGERGKIKRN